MRLLRSTSAVPWQFRTSFILFDISNNAHGEDSENNFRNTLAIWQQGWQTISILRVNLINFPWRWRPASRNCRDVPEFRRLQRYHFTLNTIIYDRDIFFTRTIPWARATVFRGADFSTKAHKRHLSPENGNYKKRVHTSVPLGRP